MYSKLEIQKLTKIKGNKKFYFYFWLKLKRVLDFKISTKNLSIYKIQIHVRN